MQRRTKAAGIAAVAAVAAVACGGDAMRFVGDAMVDAGESLRDGGDAMLEDASAMGDASGRDADLPDGARPDSGSTTPAAVFEASCDRVYARTTTTRVVSSGDTTVYTLTYYYAEVDVPGLTPDNVDRVTVVTCDREAFGPVTPACPESTATVTSSCTGSLPDPYDCTINGYAEVEPGRLRFNCGTRSQFEYSNPAISDVDVGSRARTATFLVDMR